MASAAPSVPPPRRPGLRSTSPERFEYLLAAAAILRRHVASGRVSVRDLAAWWQCRVSHAHDKLRAERPISLGEVMALPDRLSLDMLNKARLVVLQRRNETRTAHR